MNTLLHTMHISAHVREHDIERCFVELAVDPKIVVNHFLISVALHSIPDTHNQHIHNKKVDDSIHFSMHMCTDVQGKDEDVRIARVGDGTVEVTAKAFKVKGAVAASSFNVLGMATQGVYFS